MTKFPSNVIPTSEWHLLYLCENMRPDEIVQYLAMTGASEYDHRRAARGMIAMLDQGPAFTVVGDIDGRELPVCAGGYVRIVGGTWNSWMVGTMAGWEKHWRAITKGTLATMDFMFEVMDAHRLQTSALASRSAAIEWYTKGLKMKPEGIWTGYASGEDVAAFARMAPGWGGQEVDHGQRK